MQDMKLFVYSKEITNPFRLFGEDEDDLTKAIAWVFAQCDEFLFSFLDEFHIARPRCDAIEIRCQESEEHSRYDVEISEQDSFGLIIEAKKGIFLPTKEQLLKYYDLIKQKGTPRKYIFSLTNADVPEYRISSIRQSMPGVTYAHVSYSRLIEIARQAIKRAKNHKSKYWLKMLIVFLREVVCMDLKDSNSVYVVPLKGDSIVEHDQQRRYHCPVGGSFTAQPVNYIGFRYDGRLQVINHVDSWQIDKDDQGNERFIFSLGPDIIPSKIVKTGKCFRGQKCYCDIDLLLTSDSLREAIDKTKARRQ